MTTVEGIAALRPCYERLQGITGNAVPFALYEWHLAWCRHFLNHDPDVKDEPLFFVLHNSSAACVAIVPFVISRRRFGPFKIVSIQALGADPAITEIRTPLIEVGYEYSTLQAVQNELSKVGNWDWIHWTGLNGALAEATHKMGELQPQPPLSDFVLDLTPSWEDFRSSRKRNIRESLRHCYNSLKRDGLGFELLVIEAPGEVRGALDRFLELHVMRASLPANAVHPNRFASAVARDFLYEVCEQLSRRGILRIFQLKIGSQIVAVRIAFAVGDRLYLYYSGFDPAWSKYSVMTTTVAEAIKYAIAHDFKTVGLSPGLDVSKTRWSPRQVDYQSAYQSGARLRSRLACEAYMEARSGEGLLGRLLKYFIPARRF
ncbi:MAG: GNAT family N-acetyltransferase [Gammaproteobacteria bacterium]